MKLQRLITAILTFAVALAMAVVFTTVLPASAHVHRGSADVAFTVQSGLNNYDVTDLFLAKAGTVSDPGVCKLYPASGNPGDPVVDPNWADIHLVDNHVILSTFVSRTDVVLPVAFRGCDDPPDVRSIATITSAATFMPKVKSVKPHSCVLKVSNLENDKVAELQFGTFRDGRPDGVVAVEPGASKTIYVTRPVLDFYGYVDTGELYDFATQAYAGYGQLKGIKVTKACKQHATGLPPGYPKAKTAAAFG